MTCIMAHPLDVGFSSASYSGFSVEQFALHYSVPLGVDGVGHHLGKCMRSGVVSVLRRRYRVPLPSVASGPREFARVQLVSFGFGAGVLTQEHVGPSRVAERQSRGKEESNSCRGFLEKDRKSVV